jgi:hypothetical protein
MAMSGSTNDFKVSSFSDLNADIGTINAETAPGTYTIDITGTIPLSGTISAISLATGVTLDIVGNGNTIIGGGEPGLYVYQGNVSIDDLTLFNNTITGGAAPANSGGFGGGSAGLGGGLFVGSHAVVTLDNVNFTKDGAVGGNAGTSSNTGMRSGPAGFGQGGTGGAQGSYGANGGKGQTGGFGGGGGGGGGGGYGTFYNGTGKAAGAGGAGGQGGFGAGNGGSGQHGASSSVHTYSTFYKVSSTHHTSHTTRTQSGGITSVPGPVTTTTHTTVGEYSTRKGTEQEGRAGSGGGGLGAGGDIFVQGGGRLKVLGGTLGAGTVQGGSGANPGSAFGSGIFLQANEEVEFAPTAGETLIIAGVIADEAGSEAGYSAEQGTINIDGPGTVVLDATNSFEGGVYISDGKLVLGAAGAAGGGDIVFTNNLTVDPTVAFTVADAPTETIVNFGKGDVLDITDLNFKTANIESFTTNGTGGGTLTLLGTQIGTADNETVTLTFSNTTGPFHLIQDAGGGTEITAICYVRGTNILTPTGNVPVESLKIGDLLVTRFGGIRPVKWIGRQSYDVRMLRNSPDKCPVRIRAGALGDKMPARDLLVSPGHAILVENILILASRLVNGVTILHEPITAEIGKLDYYQIEFVTHDCVIAEGTWAETYADAPGLRAQFHNAADFFSRYSDEAPPEALTLCAPRPERGAKLESALTPVIARAAIAPGTLEGYIDTIDAWHIQGWALDTAHPNLPVLLDIFLGDEKLGLTLACHHREDLAAAGKGTGRCAFTFTTPRRLPEDAPTRISIRRASDGANLPFAQQPAVQPHPKIRVVA